MERNSCHCLNIFFASSFASTLLQLLAETHGQYPREWEGIFSGVHYYICVSKMERQFLGGHGVSGNVKWSLYEQ